jgi:mono/diheme cytochrome c family protein
MAAMRGAPARGGRWRAAMSGVRRIAWLLLLMVGWAASAAPQGETGREGAALTNPFLGQEAAIQEGERIYRRTCIGCHRSIRGHGPSLFGIRKRMSDERFLETVTHGRKGTNMPAWGNLLSQDQIWAVHAFVNSRDRL